MPQDPGAPSDLDRPADLRYLRWGLVACQALTILVTWPLWQSRIDHPWMPHLPVIPDGVAWFFQFDWGWLLLLSLVWVVIHAPSGLIAHAVFLSLAILVDQVRLQPEFVSLLILMMGTLPNRPLQVIARFHLGALWFYAGFHKLLSEGYWNEGGADHLIRSFPAIGRDPAQFIAIASAFAEVAIGVLWMIGKTRLVAAVAAVLIHFGILLSLLAQQWNVAVWPWNIALMGAAIGFSIDLEESAPYSAARAGPAGLIGVALMILSPLLFYVGYFDTYLCHCLYSMNTASAAIFLGPDDAKGQYLSERSMEAVHVPFPPEHRMFEQYFRKVAQPGDMLLIRDKRWYYHYRGWHERWLEKPIDGGPDSEIIERTSDELLGSGGESK